MGRGGGRADRTGAAAAGVGRRDRAGRAARCCAASRGRTAPASSRTTSRSSSWRAGPAVDAHAGGARRPGPPAPVARARRGARAARASASATGAALPVLRIAEPAAPGASCPISRSRGAGRTCSRSPVSTTSTDAGRRDGQVDRAAGVPAPAGARCGVAGLPGAGVRGGARAGWASPCRGRRAGARVGRGRRGRGDRAAGLPLVALHHRRRRRLRGALPAAAAGRRRRRAGRCTRWTSATPAWSSPRRGGCVVDMRGPLRTPEATSAPVGTTPPGSARDVSELRRRRRRPRAGRRTSDPVVAPPLYGGWPAGADVRAGGGWLRAVNVDPVRRAAAGLGARVVRAAQESLVAAAWEQAGELQAATAALNRGRLAAEVGRSLTAAPTAWRRRRAAARRRHARLPARRGALGAPAPGGQCRARRAGRRRARRRAGCRAARDDAGPPTGRAHACAAPTLAPREPARGDGRGDTSPRARCSCRPRRGDARPGRRSPAPTLFDYMRPPPRRRAAATRPLRRATAADVSADRRHRAAACSTRWAPRAPASRRAFRHWLACSPTARPPRCRSARCSRTRCPGTCSGWARAGCCPASRSCAQPRPAGGHRRGLRRRLPDRRQPRAGRRAAVARLSGRPPGHVLPPLLGLSSTRRERHRQLAGWRPGRSIAENMGAADAPMTVMVIRGDLVRRYPDVHVFLQEGALARPSRAVRSRSSRLPGARSTPRPSSSAESEPGRARRRVRGRLLRGHRGAGRAPRASASTRPRRRLHGQAGQLERGDLGAPRRPARRSSTRLCTRGRTTRGSSRSERSRHDLGLQRRAPRARVLAAPVPHAHPCRDARMTLPECRTFPICPGSGLRRWTPSCRSRCCRSASRRASGSGRAVAAVGLPGHDPRRRPCRRADRGRAGARPRVLGAQLAGGLTRPARTPPSPGWPSSSARGAPPGWPGGWRP